MKKTIALIAMLVVSFCRLQAQSENRISNSLAAKFAADFPHATSPRWTHDEGYALAPFQSDAEGNVYLAYFDNAVPRIALGPQPARTQVLPDRVMATAAPPARHFGTSTLSGRAFHVCPNRTTPPDIARRPRAHPPCFP